MGFDRACAHVESLRDLAVAGPAGRERGDPFLRRREALGDNRAPEPDATELVPRPPGNSIWAPGQSVSFGNPFYLTGSWTVETATGEFSSLPVGTAGTDALHFAGAHSSGTYVTP
jgi:hypothetical protein